jgi:SEC-C motif
MPRDFRQSQAELEVQLSEQLDHIQSSCERFDKGVSAEAKRLALAVRILVHDRRQSPSLLSQLGRKGMNFWDSAVAYDPSNLADQWGLLVMTAGGNLPTFVAPFDRGSGGRWIAFEDWWTGVIFRDRQQREMTRAGLILAVANQDGGAHVDPALEAAYAALSRQNSLGWTKTYTDGRHEPADPPHLEAVRQIAHEVLKTLVPGYAKRRHQPSNTAFGWGLQVRKATPEELAEHRRRQPVPVVGRNDPCPCGSGKKYKKCHGGGA